MRSVCALFLVLAACASDDPKPDVGGSCEHPLDDAVAGMLTTGLESHYDMRPGSTHQFQLGTTECCYFFTAVDACVSWSVSPTTGASIDADGNFALDPSTKDGDVFTVTANVEDGRKIVTAEVYVYTPEGNPFIGIWHEQAQLPCGGGTEHAPASIINELRFTADHTIRVTWQPFEIYVDYWADYTYDLTSHAFSFTGATGNYVPTDIDATGSFSIDSNGNLVLQDMWLGTPSGDTTPPSCGHVFTR